MKPAVFNYEDYSDVAADLKIAHAEVETLKKELSKANERIFELEQELKDERYRHDRLQDWDIASERERRKSEDT